MKIITIVGARPQFIKAAVISRVIAKTSGIEEVIIHTGQHYDTNMSDIFFEEMGIPRPNYNLNVNGLGHGAMTGQMMEKIETVLLDEKPDWVLVYGDTNSTLAGAITARKLNIPLAHVEAGLRSFNMKMPEEVNRIVTDRISDILFCPTETAVANLLKEGFSNIGTTVELCGDVMFDAALYYFEKRKKPSFNIPDEFILATVHRAENTDDPKKLGSIFSALNNISRKIPVVLPLHPRTKIKLEQAGFDFADSKIVFIPPVGYLEMVWMLGECRLVMTDSGGLQKEAFFFKKHCVVLREETEWTELIKNKLNFLAGSDASMIEKTVEQVLTIGKTDFDKGFYGDGNAGEKIINSLIDKE